MRLPHLTWFAGLGRRCLVAALLLAGGTIARAVSLSDFGFQSMRVDDKPALGTRPLLLIIGNFAGDPPLAGFNFETLIFGPGYPNLMDYYREISHNRFTWSRAGVLRANFSQGERTTKNSHEAILAAAADQNPNFQWTQLDANRDGRVTGSELSILIIDNQGAGGQTRPVQWGNLSLAVSRVSHMDTFMTFCHEICHTLGALDLYGLTGLHGDLSLMGPTIGNSERRSWHLDPWHKLVLGWISPRVVSLRGDGRAVLTAIQFATPEDPVLLFDPLRGTQEYLLLEHRIPAPENRDPGYDRNVFGWGVRFWQVWSDLNHRPVLAARHRTLPHPAQPGWTICKKCQGCFYRPGQGTSRCPAGGNHEPYDSHDFDMVMNAPTAPGQREWRWCRKCQSLFFGGNPNPTRCPADNGAHDGSQSANYTLYFTSSAWETGQRGWTWCNKCQGLFYAGFSNNMLNSTGGACPVGGTHNNQGSGEYSQHYQIYSVFNVPPTNAFGNPPFLRMGASQGWLAGARSSRFRWLSDGAEIPVDFTVDASLRKPVATVSWKSELMVPAFAGEWWVDHRFPVITPGLGNELLPFHNLREAVDGMPFYGRLFVKPPGGFEAITIRQSMRIEAPRGPVTIGR